MIQYEIIDMSEGIGFNKTSKSLECMICHYWYFNNIGFKYEPYVCNGCHEYLFIDPILLVWTKNMQLVC